jgi:hypothetical protein
MKYINDAEFNIVQLFYLFFFLQCFRDKRQLTT